MKKILVTGGTTFVSKYVAQYFVNVYEEIDQRNYFSFYNYEYYLDVSRQSKIYPETMSLEEGLKDTVKWYLEHSTEVNKKPYFEYIDENLVVK